jgi:hypothetical protein
MLCKRGASRIHAGRRIACPPTTLEEEHMSLVVAVPGRALVRLEHLLVDVNGTLSKRGNLVPGVIERMAAARQVLDVRLISADT